MRNMTLMSARHLEWGKSGRKSPGGGKGEVEKDQDLPANCNLQLYGSAARNSGSTTLGKVSFYVNYVNAIKQTKRIPLASNMSNLYLKP